MITTHEARIEPRFLDMILEGRKTVEIRCGFEWGYVCNHTDRHFLKLTDGDRTRVFQVAGQHAYPKGEYTRQALIDTKYKKAGFDTPEDLATYLINVYGTKVMSEHVPFVVMHLEDATGGKHE